MRPITPTCSTRSMITLCACDAAWLSIDASGNADQPIEAAANASHTSHGIRPGMFLQGASRKCSSASSTIKLTRVLRSAVTCASGRIASRTPKESYNTRSARGSSVMLCASAGRIGSCIEDGLVRARSEEPRIACARSEPGGPGRARAPAGCGDSRSILLRLQIFSLGLMERRAIGGRAHASIDRPRQRS